MRRPGPKSLTQHADIVFLVVLAIVSFSTLYAFGEFGTERSCSSDSGAPADVASDSLSVVSGTESGLEDAHGVELVDGGDYAVVADRNGDGIAVYDVANKNHIVQTDELRDDTYLNKAHYVAVGPDGEYAYVGAYRYFTVVDISNRQDIDIVGHVHVGQGNQEPLVINQSVAALAGSKADAVYTIDISKKTDPAVLDSVGGGGEPYYMDGARHLAYQDGTLYYTADVHDEHVGALDVTDPSNVTLRDVREVQPTVEGNDPHEVVVAGDYAYVADMQADDINGWEPGEPDDHGGVHVYDVSNPSAIQWSTSVTQSDESDAYLDDVHGLRFDSERDLLFASSQSHTMCSDNSCGLNVLDVSNRTNPVLVDALKADDWIGPAQQVDFDGEYLLTVSHGNTKSCQGITAYRYDGPDGAGSGVQASQRQASLTRPVSVRSSHATG